MFCKDKKQDKIIDRFEVNAHQGLNDEQVRAHAEQKLINNTKQKTSKSYFRIFFDNIFTFFNMLWLGIFIALMVVKSYENLFFIIVIVSNIFIAIFQEIRSKITVEKLSLVTSPKVTVVRNGEEIEVLSNEIVLDDIIVLASGNQIPADCILLEGLVDVNESLLTGESKAVKKQKDSELLAGSFLTSGKCYARVVKVGNDCYIQSIAKAAKKFKQPNSTLFRDLKRIIRWIGIAIVPIGTLVFCNNYFWAKTVGGGPASSVGNVAESVSATCGSLVGMIPAGMFLLISIALTVGVIKLAEKKTLVQDIYSIEMLARSNILCLDKTGTITDGTMHVKEVIPYNNTSENIINLAISSIFNAQQSQNTTARALIQHFDMDKKWDPTYNIAFSSERKYTATSFKDHGTFAIGAKEYIKAKSTKEIDEAIKLGASQGFRVLVLAHSEKQLIEDKLPTDLKIISIILIEDTIRPDAAKTIKWFKENDVQIKIISGDDPQTVSFIAGRVGVENYDKFINLEGMPLEDVAKIANDYTVFGRVSPEQKHTIIKTLKKNNVVAMTGDGVNDTLALKEADCSIAMADGSEVARNISHLVLLNSNFSSLPKVVEEGRQVVNNVQKSSTLFLMKTILTILLSIFVIAIQTKYPFQPKNMFLLDFFIIGISSFFLALLPNKDLIRGNFIPSVLKKAVPYGLIMFGGIVTVLLLGKFNILDAEETVSLATIVLTAIGLVNLIFLCYPFTWLKACIMTFALIGVVGAAFIMPLFFGITLLTAHVWKLAIILVLGAIVAHLIIMNIKLLIQNKRKRI